MTKASFCFRLDSHPDRLTFSQYLSLFFISSSSLSSESIVSHATPLGGPLPPRGITRCIRADMSTWSRQNDVRRTDPEDSQQLGRLNAANDL